jgi:hypothetical protein
MKMDYRIEKDKWVFEIKRRTASGCQVLNN